MSQLNTQEISEFFLENQEICSSIMELFSIFGNETRFKILCILRRGDFCVNDIVEVIGAKPSNVSQQLKILTLGSYLTKRREGKSIIYHLASDFAIETIDFFHRLYDK